MKMIKLNVRNEEMVNSHLYLSFYFQKLQGSTQKCFVILIG
jgi:hypothetical protein